MRLAEYLCGNRPRLGIVADTHVYDVPSLYADAPTRMRELIEQGPDGWGRLQQLSGQAELKHAVGLLGDVRICAPLPDPPKLLCVAANYRAHITESGFQAPDANIPLIPQFFSKFPSTCIIGPEDTIPITSRNVALDWELELAVVLGRGGKNIPEAQALDHVFGYTIVNDVSERKLNSTIAGRHLRSNDNFFDWLTGKWFDGSAPLGPLIITADEVRDPQNLGMKLWVNDTVMQESSTSRMITSVRALISYISSILTLQPGDVIATGTPEGTGLAKGRFLCPGDRVRGWIESIGYLQNSIAQEMPT